MKKLILFIAFMVSVVNANGAKLVEGSLDCFKGEKNIAVSLDCSKLVYKKNRPFQDFLDKAPRMENWEEESLKYFFKKFNEETFKYHFSSVPVTSKNKGKFEMVITPLEINGGGGIKAHAYIFNKETNEKVATIEFKTDGDDNDEITLRDPMKEAGEDLGSLFKKFLKKK